MGENKKILFSNGNQINTKAYRELFYLLHGRLVLFALKFTCDLQVSQDIVQDAFLKLWEKSPSFSNRDVLKAYLFQSVKNNCLNHLRHIKIMQSAADKLHYRSVEAEKASYLSSDDPLQSLLEHDVRQKISEIIRLMPEKCRQVFLHSRKDEMKNKEIADEMGISVKMVEKQISKALLILRTNLSDYVSIALLMLLNVN